MKESASDRVIEPYCRVGRTAQTTADWIAVLCLFFGIACAAFAPISVHERFAVVSSASVLAFGFYMGGYILRQLLGLGGRLGEVMIGACCAKLLAPLAGEILRYRVQYLENRVVEQSRRLDQSDMELKHLSDELEIALNAEADLRSALIEIDGRANAALQSVEAEKTKLQAALDRANGERARLTYELSVAKRQPASMQRA